MTDKEIEAKIIELLELRDKKYREVQDFSRADFFKTEYAISYMNEINIEIRQLKREQEYRKE